MVIVDSLGHNRAVESKQFQQVRRALINLFDRDYDNLRLTRCRTIYTLPTYAPVSAGKVVRRVTNVKIVTRNGDLVPAGVEALRTLLARRIPSGDLLRIFPDDKAGTCTSCSCSPWR